MCAFRWETEKSEVANVFRFSCFRLDAWAELVLTKHKEESPTQRLKGQPCGRPSFVSVRTSNDDNGDLRAALY